jgi:protein TonB
MRRARSISVPTDLRFPLVGELHPLQREYETILYRALVSTVLVHLGAIAIGLLYQWARSDGVVATTIVCPGIDPLREFAPPPSITQMPQPILAAVQPLAPPAVGIPEPVPDFRADDATLATLAELSQSLTPTDLTSLTGEVGTVAGDLFVSDALPAPTDFVPREEEPELVTMSAPHYPDLARRAGIEGRVLIRALVGKDGRVLEAFVIEGNAILNEAALQSVRGAIFRPALQQQRPIAVWVVIPLQFVLNE